MHVILPPPEDLGSRKYLELEDLEAAGNIGYEAYSDLECERSGYFRVIPRLWWCPALLP